MLNGWIGMLLYGIFHMPCIFHALTGLYCPGCGGTRAVKYLLQGQIGMSIRYHPIVVYAVLAAAAEMITWLLSRLFRNPRFFLGRGEQLAYLGAVIVAVNWIVKNVCLICLGVDLLSIPL